MANWFEDITKTMADEKLPRRVAIRRISGTIVGVTLASLLPGQALANARPDGKAKCSGPINCSSPPGSYFCPNNPNPNCACFTNIKGGGTCGCNSYCSQVPTCNSSHDCSKGTFCAVSTGCNCGYSSGVCIAKCIGKNKNCQLGGAGTGLTAIGHL